MANLGSIKVGAYGKYYAYFDHGERKNLGLGDQGEDLTPDQLDELIDKATLTFTKDGVEIRAKLVSYFNKHKNRWAQFISYKRADELEVIEGSADLSTSIEADVAIIEENKDKIIFFYSDNVDYYAEAKTAKYLSELGLSKKYMAATFSTELLDVTKVAIYYGKKNEFKDTSKHVWTILLKNGARTGYRVARTEISVAEYNRLLDEEKKERKEKEAEKEAKNKAWDEKTAELKAWVDDLKKKVFADASTLPTEEIVKNLEPVVASVPFKFSNTAGCPRRMAEILNYLKLELRLCYSCLDKSDLEEVKTRTLKELRQYYDYHTYRLVRKTIYEQVKKDGLEAVVDSVPIDLALDLGRFTQLKRALKKGKKGIDAVYFICYDMYQDTEDIELLRQSILNMLKTYHEFYDFPAKDIKALAKFIATHNMKEYYDIVLGYDEAVEVILDNSKDRVLKKRALTSIAGGGRMDLSFLKTKSFYFEKKAKVRENIIINDPVTLLDDLRKLIPAFNASSDVAILTNIELQPDGWSYVYQFYTYSDDASGKDFDGRRIQYMTRLYNSDKTEDKRIYFDYDI